MRVRPASLAKTVISPNSSRPSRLGALVLLVLAAHTSIAPHQLEHPVDGLLVATLDILRAGRTDPLLKLADGETLFWLWWCVEQQLELEEPFADDLLFDLVEVRLVPLQLRGLVCRRADAAPRPARRPSPLSPRSRPTRRPASSPSACSLDSSRRPTATRSTARRRRSTSSSSSSSTARRRASERRASGSSRRFCSTSSSSRSVFVLSVSLSFVGER